MGLLRLPARHLIQAFEGIGEFSHKKHERSRLRVGFRPALFPFFKRPHVDSQLTRENRARATKSLSSIPNQHGTYVREWRWFHFVSAQRDFPFAPALHCRNTFHELSKNVSLLH